MIRRLLLMAMSVALVAVVDLAVSRTASAQWWGPPPTVVYRVPARTYVVRPAPVQRVYVAPQPVFWQPQPRVMYRPRPIMRPNQWVIR